MKDSIKGGRIAIVSSFPIALLFALLYRFPIPMGGYIGPFSGKSHIGVINSLKAVVLAWVVYGILGGFVLLFVGGAVTGTAISSKCSESDDKKHRDRMVTTGGIIFAILCVGLLSNLDFIIGAW